MTPNPLILIICLVIVIDVVIFGGLWFLADSSKANPPEQIGRDHFTADGPSTPNWVSSLSENQARQVEPLRFDGDPMDAWDAAKTAVADLPKTKIVVRDPDYLHAECRSPFFGFVDDLELKLIPDQQQIEVRSASRVGRSDLGANRKRIELLRNNFHAQLE